MDDGGGRHRLDRSLQRLWTRTRVRASRCDLADRVSWPDFVGITLLLLINATIGFYEERSAGKAVKALMASLAPRARVRRGGAWTELESKELVVRRPTRAFC